MEVHPEITLFFILLGMQMHFANEYIKDHILNFQLYTQQTCSCEIEA